MTQFGGQGGSFGPNAWLVDDMYDRFLADPGSVSESWREFFADYRPAPVPAPQPPTQGQSAAPAGPAPAAATAVSDQSEPGSTRPAPAATEREKEEATPLRGAA
jgi:multifunctional 2-oxoglutarate metabolism enzyme